MLAHSYMWLLHKLLRVDTPTPTPLPPNSPQLAGPGWGGALPPRRSLRPPRLQCSLGHPDPLRGLLWNSPAGNAVLQPSALPRLSSIKPPTYSGSSLHLPVNQMTSEGNLYNSLCNHKHTCSETQLHLFP